MLGMDVWSHGIQDGRRSFWRKFRNTIFNPLNKQVM